MSLVETVGIHLYRQGDQGPVVRSIQLALAGLGYKLRGTGFFGGATDAAVTAFQRRAGVTSDGVVGAKTAAAIDAAAGAPHTEPPDVATEIARPLWLIYGLTLLGTTEAPGARDNKVIIDWAKDEGGDIAKEYTHDSIPFCALFENHIFTKVGLKGTETLWALDWNADEMQKRLGHRWPGVKLPGVAVGAVAPMLRNGGGHVITVVGKDQHGNIMGLGSNQSDTTSVIPFPLARLNKGFWWPASVLTPLVTGIASLPIVKSDGRVSQQEA